MQAESYKRIFANRQGHWWFPALFAFGFFILYLSFISTGITLRNASSVARWLGWEGDLIYQSPLMALLGTVAKIMPIASQPAMLSILTSACAAGALFFLARSVMLLPYIQPHTQRLVPFPHQYECLPPQIIWMPALMAMLVCGPLPSFWEHATIPTGESLDLLLFAVCVWCLLEFRQSRAVTWLKRLAFLFGLAVTNNAAMLAYFPFFLVATIWMAGRELAGWVKIPPTSPSRLRAEPETNSDDTDLEEETEASRNFVINWRLLRQVALWGMAGLLFYFTLPLFHLVASTTENSIWRELKLCLSAQKTALLGASRPLALLLSAPVLLMLAFIGIRWHFDMSIWRREKRFLLCVVFHVAHALLLAVSVYLMLDHRFGFRTLSRGLAYLPLYYLNALVLTYSAGYFLLLVTTRPAKDEGDEEDVDLYRDRKLFRRTLIASLWVVMFGLGIYAYVRSLPVVQQNHADYLSNYGQTTARSLPPAGAILLGDDLTTLTTVRFALAKSGSKCLPIYVPALGLPQYHYFLARKYPDRWPAPGTNIIAGTMDSQYPMQLLMKLAQTNTLYALQPLYGLPGEYFKSLPNNLVYKLTPRPTNPLTRIPLTPQEAEDNRKFWGGYRISELSRIGENLKKTPAKISPEAAAMASLYSRTINFLGVTLQRQNELKAAGECFELASRLNPKNYVASLNKNYNTEWQTNGHPSALTRGEAPTWLKNFLAQWRGVLTVFGPPDEPHGCFALGTRLQTAGWHRQASEELSRTIFFDPQSLLPHLLLAASLNAEGAPDETLKVIADMRRELRFRTNQLADSFLVTELEAWAYQAKKNYSQADQLMLDLIAKTPTDLRPLNTLMQFFLRRGDLAKAENILATREKYFATNFNFLVNIASVKLLRTNAAAALPYLERAAIIQSTNAALLNNRGLAFLGLKRFDEALKDFEAMRQLGGISPLVLYGLGEAHYQKQDYKKSRDYFENFLKMTTTDNQDRAKVVDRLREIEQTR